MSLLRYSISGGLDALQFHCLYYGVQRRAVCKLFSYSLLDYFLVRWLLVKAMEFLVRGLDVHSEEKKNIYQMIKAEAFSLAK